MRSSDLTYYAKYSIAYAMYFYGCAKRNVWTWAEEAPYMGKENLRVWEFERGLINSKKWKSNIEA